MVRGAIRRRRRGGRFAPAAVPVLLALALAACGPHATSAPTAAPSAPASGAPGTGAAWLCRPGLVHNPCEGSLDAEADGPGTRVSRERFTPVRRPAVDCFYVYPTVSRAPGTSAPQEATPAVVGTVRAQAGRMAGACRLWVPLYRQLTLAALHDGRFFDPAALARADADVSAAWHDYLRRSGSRGVVLVGHSQGAMALERLLAAEVLARPAQRRRLVSALLLGGNVLAPEPGRPGGLPACRRPGQLACLVAYSAYAAPPPPTSVFGRSASGLRARPEPLRRVLCVDPTLLTGGRPGVLHPYLPWAGAAAFVTYPGHLAARCRTSGGASWLAVTTVAGTTGPPLKQALGPDWGLHPLDVNLALGDLVEVVRRQGAAWAARRRPV